MRSRLCGAPREKQLSFRPAILGVFLQSSLRASLLSLHSNRLECGERHNSGEGKDDKAVGNCSFVSLEILLSGQMRRRGREREREGYKQTATRCLCVQCGFFCSLCSFVYVSQSNTWESLFHWCKECQKWDVLKACRRASLGESSDISGAWYSFIDTPLRRPHTQAF